MPDRPFRFDENRTAFAIQCPRLGRVITVVEGQATRVYETRPVGVKLSDVDIALREALLQGEVPST
jgi:hypothetical protein